MQTNVSIKDVVAFLNELTKIDGDAMKALVTNRVPCNEKFGDHETVQVTGDNTVGLLGIINGMFGVDENLSGPIAARFNENGTLVGFMAVNSDNTPSLSEILFDKLVQLVPSELGGFVEEVDDLYGVVALQDLVRYTDRLIEIAAFRTGYIEARVNMGGRETAAKEANRVMNAVRKALGYSPLKEIRF